MFLLKKISKIPVFLLVISIFFSIFFVDRGVLATEKDNVNVYVFERFDCAHCKDEISFLKKLEKKQDNFKLITYEIGDLKNFQNFKKIIEKYSLSNATPLTLVGDSVIVGYDNDENSGKQILKKFLSAKENKKFNLDLEYYLNSSTKKSLDDSAPSCNDSESESCEITEQAGLGIEIEKKESVSFFGTSITIKDFSLFTLSSVLGFIDGFNPCAMWVLLTFLIALSQIGDRRKMAILAGIFILAEGIMYYIILNFWSSAWKFLPNKNLITLIIGIFAILAGLYFLYKWWKNRKKFVCDTTSSEQQNKISQKIINISKKPLTFVTFFAVLFLAFSVNIIEVACSLGIPQTFTSTLSLNNLDFWSEQFYIFTYTFFYMLDDFIVFGLALWGYKKFATFGMKYSKLSTLFAGALILILGIFLAFFPELLAF